MKSGAHAAEASISALEIPMVAASLGGPESLVARPAAAVHAGMSAGERAKAGIGDALIRFSTGLEATEDLGANLAGALASPPGAVA